MQNLKQKKGTEENNEVINEENAIKSGSNASPLVKFLFKGILQGLISIPLTIHIYNFSISISVDSMLWEFVIDKKFFKDKNNEGTEIEGEGGKQEKEKLPSDDKIKEDEKLNNENPGTTDN